MASEKKLTAIIILILFAYCLINGVMMSYWYALCKIRAEAGKIEHENIDVLRNIDL